MSEEPQGPVAGDSLTVEELRSATVRGLRWTAIARPAVEVVLLASMVLLARLISPVEFGHYAVAVIVGELAMIPSAGVGTALVQRKSVTHEQLQAGYALALLCAIALIALTFLAALTIVGPTFGHRTAWLVELSSPLCLLAAAQVVPMSVLQRRLEFPRLAMVDVANTVTRAGGSVGLALVGLGGEAMVLGAMAGALVGAVLSWAWARPPAPRLRRRPARDVLGYGGPAAVAAVSWIGFRNGDYAIVAARLGALAAGFYFRAYTLGVEYQKKVSQVVNSVGFPVLARTKSGADMHRLRGQMVQMLTCVLFPVLVLLAITGPVAIPWLFGAEWTPAVLPTQIIALGGASTLVIDAVGAALMATGRPRALLAFGWGHFVLYMTGVFIATSFGLVGVAVAAGIVHTAFMVVAYTMLLSGSGENPLRALWHDIAPATVACAVLAAAAVPTDIAMTAVHAAVVPHLAAVVTVAVIFYVLALRGLYPGALRSLRALARRILPERRGRRTGNPVLAPAPADSGAV